MPPKHKKWNPNDMIKAVKAVKNKEMGYLKASKVFGVPKGTVERYVKSGKDPEELVDTPIGRKTILSPKLENELVQYALAMEERFFGLRARDIKRLAFQLAIRNNISHPFSGVKKSAGKKWLRLFLNRHPQLSMRTPQGMSAARIKSFTPENVSSFFDLYEAEYEKVQDPFQRIFNVDETGITVVQHKHSKVISLRGKKQVSSLTSAERGKLVTVITCMNASGVYVPPLLIFPRKNMKTELMLGAPNGAIAECHISGWVQADIFTRWLDHFIKFTKPTASDPVLLVLDGHYSHTRNIDLIDLAKQNHVTIICLPPHSTNKMQPLDVSFMSPLKTFYAQEIENWLRENQLSTVSPYAISSVFCKAYNRAATMETSCNGFRKTGLVPINRNIFRDSDFSVHRVEDREDTVDPCEVDHHGDKTAQQIHENAATPADFTGNNLVNQDASTSNAKEIASINNPVDSVQYREQQRTPSPSLEQQIQNKLVSPTDICPLPSYKQQNTVSRRSGKALVITRTPYKNELQASLEKKQMKAIPKKKLEVNLTRNQNNTSKQNQPSTSGAKRSINQNQPSTSSAKRSKRIRIPSHSSSSSECSGSLKLDDSSSDESGGSDAECLFCTGRYSEDKKGEKWAKCSHCSRWAHEDCGEITNNIFICSFCEGKGFFE